MAVLLVGPGYFAEAMGHLPGDPMGEAMGEATQAAFERGDPQPRSSRRRVIAIVSAAVVSLAVAARIAGPVVALAGAARRIAGGHYAERVPVADPDELGELATSFNEMAGSLEATERRRLQLVGDVAHELRTPLTTLDGYLEGLEDGVIAPTAATWRLLRAETGRLTRLVNDLSELWRAEARQLPLRIEAVDVAAVAGEVVERFRPLAAARGIDLDLRRRDRPSAAADRDRVAQVLANYLSNALRHAPDGSVVAVATRRRRAGLGHRHRPGPGPGGATSWRPSSSASTGSTRRAAARPAARGSASRSCARWPRRWAAAPGRRATARDGRDVRAGAARRLRLAAPPGRLRPARQRVDAILRKPCAGCIGLAAGCSHPVLIAVRSPAAFKEHASRCPDLAPGPPRAQASQAPAPTPGRRESTAVSSDLSFRLAVDGVLAQMAAERQGERHDLAPACRPPRPRPG